MGAVALVALLAGGPLGMCLALAYGVTHFIKITKVDAEYAKQGKTPPSYALINKWLDRRTAKGAKPEKPAKYGMWRYGWQRWQAMWEDLADRHKEVRAQYKQAAAQAKAKGEPPPPRPTLKETLTGWKWHLDQLAPPPAAAEQPKPSDDVEPAAAPQPPADDKSDQPQRKTPTGISPRDRTPRHGRCPKCSWGRPLTTVGWCEPCVMAGGHGFCSRCHGLMIRDGDVFRHGPDQGCDAVAPAANKVPMPDSRPGPNPDLQQRLPQTSPATTATPRAAESGTTNPQGDSMVQPTAQQQSGEVIGLTSAINYAAAVAAAHEAHSLGGGEQYRASLGQAEVGPETIQSAAAAQEASEIAAAAWRAHQSKLQEQLAAKEAVTAETGSKTFLLAD